VYSSTGCIGPHCTDLATISVDLGHSPKLPLWLVIESEASVGGKNDWSFWPEGSFDAPAHDPQYDRSVQRAVALPPNDDCVDVRIYALDGSQVFADRRCAPNRCAIYDMRAAGPCGGPGSSLVDAERIAAGSCSDPPVLEERFETIRYPDEDAGVEVGGEARPDAAERTAQPTRRKDADAPVARAAVDGCDVVPGERASSVDRAAFLIAAWMLLARRRSTSSKRSKHGV
jgi:hypothetical protein